MFPFSKLNIVPRARVADRRLCSSSMFFPLATIPSIGAQFKDNDLGFLLLKDGNNLGILFDSLVSVPKFCFGENYCQLRRLRKIFILFRLCCCGNLLR